ncbi:hypothetical protein OEZ86_004772 [Tetradesmus obliquus]|nr:hypothetical protein OEZ86_004772 [Tetradesmus obliquus]
MRALGLCVLSALLISVYYADLVITDSLPADSTDSNTWPGKERLLVLCKDSIWAFDLATGADQGEFLSKASTGGKTWGLDSIAEKDGLLYVGTYFGKAGASTVAPGAVQVFTCNGRYVRRFDQGFDLKTPYGMQFIPTTSTSRSSSSSSKTGGGTAHRQVQQLAVSGLGNDALVLYHGKTGQFEGFLAQATNNTASPQGPNGMLLLDRTLFLATEGSITTASGEVSFPSNLQSALLAIDLDSKAVQLVDAPSPAPNAGYVSLLGIALLPPYANIGVSSARAGKTGGARNPNKHRAMVVSDFAGGLRYYSSSPPYSMLKVVDTTFIDPVTGKRTNFNYGSVRVFGRFIYLAAFDAATLDGMVLRYKLDGTPAGVTQGMYAGTPVWIGPSAGLPRAIGLKILNKGCRSFKERP